jgi:ATP-dependent Clp protease ATP-binding subunit ClpX
MLPWMRLGESIRKLHLAGAGEESDGESDSPERIARKIAGETELLQSFLALEPPLVHFRKLFGVHQGQAPRAALVQILALVLFNDLVRRVDETNDSIANAAGPLFSSDALEGSLIARTYVAEMIDRKLLAVHERALRASVGVSRWVTGGNALLNAGLTEHMVHTHFAKKAESARKKADEEGAAQPVATPRALYEQLKEYVVSNDAACRQLAVRGALHLNRRELLQGGVEAGSNECILLIGQSGTGKTYIAETFGRLCGLPFASMSASNITATGYVGLDMDDALKTLVRTAGNPGDPQTLEKARYGVLFMDEWDKRRAQNSTGVDLAGSHVQYEYLRLISGTRMTLGNRRNEREDQSVEFNSNGTFFVFAGAFAGMDQIIKRMGREQSSIGFGEAAPLRTTPRIYDALQEFGLIPEFLNRVTSVIAMKPLDTGDLIQIATSPHGVLQTYNRILTRQGLAISIDPAGLAELAGFCVETRLFARGIRLVISSLVEDLVFNEVRDEQLVSAQEVRRAIERVGCISSMTDADSS